jgi:hypothetical protein
MAILLFVHLTRHSSTASEQLSFISLVSEIGTAGLMSGDGKRSVADRAVAGVVAIAVGSRWSFTTGDRLGRLRCSREKNLAWSFSI